MENLKGSTNFIPFDSIVNVEPIHKEKPSIERV